MLRFQASGVASFTPATTSVTIKNIPSGNISYLDYFDLFTANTLSGLTVQLEDSTTGFVICTLGAGRQFLNSYLDGKPLALNGGDNLVLTYSGSATFTVNWSIAGYTG